MVENTNDKLYTAIIVVQIVQRNLCDMKYDRIGSSPHRGKVYILDINENQTMLSQIFRIVYLVHALN